MRVALRERLVADTQLVGHAFSEVLDEDIGFLRQLTDNLYGLWIFEIKGEALLMPVIGLKIEIGTTRRSNEGTGNTEYAPARVPADALFDLDDFGTQVSQHHGRDRPLLPNRPVNNADAIQWSLHSFPS